MITCRTSNKILKEKLRKMAERSPGARRAAVVAMTTKVVRQVEQLAPQDTRRYLRGWVEAANMAGLGPFPLPALQQAKWRDRILKRLIGQVRFWEMVVQRYERAGRRDRWYQQAQRKLERSQRELQRFGETPGEAVIAFNVFGSSHAAGDFTSVRHKIYGGRGRIVSLASRTYIVLHNLEPHATLVEWRYRVMARASAAFKGLLATGGKGAYIAKVAAGLFKREAA